jgi:hypothetical protein
VFSTNKTDRNDITEILLKVALSPIKQTNKINAIFQNQFWEYIPPLITTHEEK